MPLKTRDSVKCGRGCPLAQPKTIKPPKYNNTPLTILSNNKSKDIPLVPRRKAKKIDEYKDEEDKL
jgi:hypothetical protein